MPARVDWKRAPKGAKWWAMDQDGHAFWYMAPDFIAGTAFWFSDEIHAPTFDYAGDWKESLTERPAGRRG
ncbi:MAG: bacteriophage protein [Herbaspirillum sp.]|jgi:hypothetical protein|nr:bacteriophage protein [Herbaspirillum sp.]